MVRKAENLSRNFEIATLLSIKKKLNSYNNNKDYHLILDIDVTYREKIYE